MKNVLKKLGVLLVRPLILLLTYAILVALMFWYMFTDFSRGVDRGMAYYMLAFLVPYFLLYLASIIAHEVGHVIGGLISGYRFSCLRVGSLAVVHDGNRLRIKRFSLPGTGGQCIMFPPDLKDGRMPVIAYYLGGSAMNLALALLSATLFFPLRPTHTPALWVGLLGMINLYMALRNAIPIRSKWVINDGMNALQLTRHPEIIPYYWIFMKTTELTTQGVRQKDMPAEWFQPAEEGALPDDVLTSHRLVTVSRLFDAHRYQEAAAVIRATLDSATQPSAMIQGQLVTHLMLCELMEDGREDVLAQLNTPAQKKFMKAMRHFPTVLLLQYAMALLIDDAPEKAQKLRAEYDKFAAQYPYPLELQSDYEAMALIDARYAARTAQDTSA